MVVIIINAIIAHMLIKRVQFIKIQLTYPEIYEYTCEYITIFKDKDGETVFEIDAINFRFNDFGKTVFLTREDAEKALGERDGE